ncbi:MAG: AMP-binding protein [Acidobacteria bacterium]|nr:AMP-binding protein [Acidobacteriota bacterium]
MPRQSVAEYFDTFRHHASEIAIVQRRGYRTFRWSYRRLVETACQFARELEARGIQRRDRVFLWGENSAEWIAVFWGCILRGAVVVPMDHIASPDFALRVLRQVDAKLIVCSPHKPALDPAIPLLDFSSISSEVSRHSRSPYAIPLGRDDLAEIIFTSGTTAEPKGVVISHGNLLANLEPLEAGINEYRRCERLVRPLRFLNLLPLSHVFGQLMAIFVPPLLAGTVVFQESLNPSEVIRAAKRERISVLVTVPRLLHTLRDKIERDLEAEGKLETFRAEFSAAASEKFLRRWWRFRRIHSNFGWKFWAFVSGGATLDAEVEAFWSRLGFVIMQGYGLTETTSLVSLNHPFRLSKGSIGRALPGREVKLDASGEILVRGESVAAGFWQGRELKRAEGEDGWFRTGDLGALDEHGNLYFKGRKKNVIVTAEGMNIFPEDLEAALRAQPEVRDAVVINVGNGAREGPCAVLLLRPEAKKDGPGDPSLVAEAVVQRANERLAEYQRMRRSFVWPDEDFPRTSTQKPRLTSIREVVESLRQPTSVCHNSNESQISALIRTITGREQSSLSRDAHLESDLNLSSVERVELMSAIEDRYQLDLNETSFSSARTVGDIENVLHQASPQLQDYPFPRWPQFRVMNLLRIGIYYLLTWPATAVRAWPRVIGRDKLRGLREPALVVCNHVTEIDIGFVLFAVPARFRHRLATAMIGERLRALRHPPAEAGLLRRWVDRLSYYLLVALFNVFPLPKESGFRESFQFAGELLDRGYSILVFPEGELTKDGRVAPFKAGIGILASKLNVPVIPMRIDGLFEVKQSGRTFARPGEVKVTIGSPAQFTSYTDPAAITLELQLRVTTL